ncbi:MAG: STAS domain-containing protein [candidate division Zixibacteria bacterium]|nr:STAS domain-containing protein [candidate division Zixibacteria bacterium]
MKIDVHKVGGVTIVAPWGRLMGGPDTNELDERLYALLGREEKRIVLDLAHTRWINSSGISVLIHHWKKCREAGADLRLANLTAKTHHVLVISKLVTVFEEFDTVDKAVASFVGGAGAQGNRKVA